MRRLLNDGIGFMLMLAIFLACDMAGTKKYILIIGLSVVFLYLGRKKKWSPDILLGIFLPAVTYLLLGGFFSVIHARVFFTSVKIVLFWMVPLLFACSLYVFYGEHLPRIIEMEFFGSCMAYLMINARFLESRHHAESVFSFSFGLFFLYYAYKKRWGMCIVSAVFMYLADKRITMLAVLAALGIRLILWLFQKSRKLVLIVWGMIMAAVFSYIWLIGSGTFEYFSKGLGIDTSGRVKIYSQVLEWFGQPVLYFGQGIGIVEKLLEAWNLHDFSNLHNDLLKFYIELGAAGLLLFLTSYGAALYFIGRKLGKEKMCMTLALFAYSIILFATDNVSIYVMYLIPFYSILFTVLTAENSEHDKK